MFKNLLIANRGEIACRIIRTAKRLGMQTTAVYSDADTNSLHVRMADKAIYIGSSPATQSYLSAKKIMDAIKISGADAVHPGYGFLSENSEFVKLLEDNGINFVGPNSAAVRVMGDKIEAKKIAQAAGVNIVPGHMTAIKNVAEAIKIASKIGFPVMLKAAAGGGGKGMRIVRSKEEMEQAFSSASNEARNSFSDSRTFIEKFIDNPRHIEIQIIGDKHGNYVCLGERECSIQRHNQKVIEEAPSSFIDEKTRSKMYKQSIALAKKVGYFSAGTIEFIVDDSKNFYFLEMNTRLQVEHPVTELITGLDLVEMMILVAAGQKLPIQQKDVILKGWAFESRIYAEDPSMSFLPSTGQISTYKEPEKNQNVRVDSGVYEGVEVSMFYDPMLAKLCTYSDTRSNAISHMKEALSKFVIRGISHNMSFLQAIYNHPRFIAGDISTNFISQEYSGGFAGSALSDEETAVMMVAAVHVCLASIKRDMEINTKIRGFSRNLGTRWIVKLDHENFPITARPIEDGYKITFGNRRFYISSKWMLGNKLFDCCVNGKNYSLQLEAFSGIYQISFRGRTSTARLFTPRAAELGKFMISWPDDAGADQLFASISGQVVDIKVVQGEQVSKGQAVIILEAMKMENVLNSPRDGVIKSITCRKGDSVTAGETLITFE